MKKFLIIVMSLVLLGIGLNYFYTRWQFAKGKSDEFSTWKKFTPQSKQFKVDLPSEPQYAKDFIAIPNSDEKRRYDMYASEKIDGTLFLVNVITYPSEVEISANDVLRQNIDELIHRQKDQQLTKILDNVFQSYKTLDFAFENKEFGVEGKAIHNGNIVYMLIYIARKENLDPEEYQYFVNSFHMIDKGGAEKW